MMDDHDEHSPRYIETQNKVLQILKKSRKWMTISELVKQLGNSDFLSDALNALEFAETIVVGGGVLIPKYKYAKPPQAPKTTKVCSKCRKPKRLAEFEREWTGRPAKCCKACRERAQLEKQRARKKVSK